jgi:hypothetical protein
VLARLYEIGDDAGAVLRWARSQTGVADPLAHWTRDELRAAFTEFCRRRDAALRDATSRLRATAGPRAIHEVLEEVSPGARAAIEAVIK